jgi:hypothetical protein
MNARRLVAVPYILVGVLPIVTFGSLAMWAIFAVWPVVGLLLSVASVVLLCRGLLCAPSARTEVSAWALTFSVWIYLHLYGLVVYWGAYSTGGSVHTALWVRTLAPIALSGSLAMLIWSVVRPARRKA